jgi:dipeptidyl aminopeptidase/acylaminoacyl peptidase
MNLRVAIALAACLFSTASLAGPSVEAFGQLPLISHPHLSPDGKRFAAIQSLDGKPTVAIYTVGAAAGTLPFVVPAEDGVIEDAVWAKNDRLIITLKKSQKQFLDNRMRTWVRAVSVAADGSDPRVLLRDNVTFDSNTFTGVIADTYLDDPTYIYVPLFVGRIQPQRMPFEDLKRYNEGSAEYDIEKVDVTTGEGHQFVRGGPYTILFLMDGHGNVLAREDETMHPLRDDIYIYENGEWRMAGDFNADADNGAHVMGMSEDEKAIVRVADNKDGYRALVRMPLEAGKQEEPLFSAPDADVLGVLHDEWSNAIIGANYAGDKMEYVYFDSEREALEKKLQSLFPGLTVHPVSADVAHNAWIVEVEGPRNPPVYYYYSGGDEPVAIASTYPQLKEGDLGEVKPYPYKARDGLDIPAYLTLPPGKSAKNLPVVIMPHGGPDERDMEHFDWWVQFLANRGYAVLQPNFRGSIGYGRKYTDAGLQQWGLKMQDDISDGVKKLIADGIADPKRICIVGASYGGYAALAGATFTPDLYACAASFAGVSDLRGQLHDENLDNGQDSKTLSFWYSRIGSIFDDPDKLDNTSPARHADQVKCPILLMHGEGDTTVRIDQSELENGALKAAGKNVTFVRFPGEDHYLNTAITRIAMLKELEKFLAAHIGQ